MEIKTLVKENGKEDKVQLDLAISSLKKSMDEFKAARKSEWKSLWQFTYCSGM
jgi:hypothetical protein